MNEQEMLVELEKLNREICTEFENLQEYVMRTERSIKGLLWRRTEMIRDSINKSLDESFEAHKKRMEVV